MPTSMQDPQDKKRRFGIPLAPVSRSSEASRDLLRAVEEEGLDKDVVIHFMDLLDGAANWKEEGGFSHHGGALHVNARSELTQP